jgi:alpha-tubulin suppressor-like RCC1 family protein
LLCWGRLFGFNEPQPVAGFTSGVAQVAMSTETICVLGTAGGVKCFGRGTEGQLGNGGTANSATPVAVTGLASGVAAITAGYKSECALTTAGAVKCWGHSVGGAIGDGPDLSDRLTPSTVTGLSSGVTAISAASQGACALLTSGTVTCWGNVAGDSRTPVAVANLSSVTSLAASTTSVCASTATGSLMCWGGGMYGQLGNGAFGNSTTPVVVSGISGVAHAIPGDLSACAVTTSGAESCWGHNSQGELGDGTALSHSTPVGVSGASSGVTQLAGAATAAHACAVISGVLECWGDNTYGQIGDGTSAQRNAPVPVIFP